MTATGAVSEAMQAIPKKAFQFIGFGFRILDPTFRLLNVKIYCIFVYFKVKKKIG